MRTVGGPGGALGTGLTQWVAGRTLDLHLAHTFASVTPMTAEGSLLPWSFVLSLWPIPLYTITPVENPWPATLGEMVWYHRPGASPLQVTLLS